MPGFLNKQLRSLTAAFLLVLACAGCSSPPDGMLAALRSSPPTPGMARLVILYPAPIMGSNGMVQVKFDALPSCDLTAGSYIVREVVPGKKNLAFSFCGISGVSPFSLKAAANQTYYLRILPYDSSLRGIMSGYPSETLPDGAPPHKGPFEIDTLKAPEALEELQSLKRVGSSQ